MFIHTVVEYRYMTCSYMCIPCIPYHNGVCYFLFFFFVQHYMYMYYPGQIKLLAYKKNVENLIMHIILFCDTCVYSFYTFSRFNMIMNYNEIDILNKDMYIMGNIIMYPCIVLFSIIKFLCWLCNIKYIYIIMTPPPNFLNKCIFKVVVSTH